ncbi:helix-turn-helix domain-containing protein [Nostoc sp. UHCC 0302]|jgi:predicted DNA-binding protein (UPF0251 family)|uniref:helix-turn-helix domain-containing protein n=1 Tax=Nostoc sp. UHCC 0302 TaxID=3134896 RepID=UPI00311CC58D
MLNRGISSSEAAKRLGVDQNRFHQILHSGQLSTRKQNGRRVVTEGALQEYLARKRPSCTISMGIGTNFNNF